MTGHDLSDEPLPLSATAEERKRRYEGVRESIQLVLQGESSWVAAMASVACLLHHAFEYFHWTGFYTAGPPGHDTLVIGPYQGHLGCLRIPYNRGVCGAAARSRSTQLVPDVSRFPGYIACASGTKSEIVVPVCGAAPAGTAAQEASVGGDDGAGALLAVLDVDSDYPDAFTQVDQEQLERLCAWLGQQGYR